MKHAARAVAAGFLLWHIHMSHAYKLSAGPDSLCGEDAECEDLKASWGCAGTWRVKCPNLEHPAGPDALDTPVAALCPADCPNGPGRPKVEEALLKEAAKASGALPVTKEDEAEVEGMLSCLAQQASGASELRREELWAVAQAEMAEKVLPIEDNQTAANVDMKAREAAHHIVDEQFQEDEEKALGKVTIGKDVVEAFAKEVENVARTCNDEGEAEALRLMMEDALELRITPSGKPSQEALKQAEAIAEHARVRCGDTTLDLDFFVQHAGVKAGVHCGSSFLQESHMKKALPHLKELNYHAKAALVLHNDSNPLGHHLVQHLMKHAEHEGHEDERPSFFHKPFLGLLHEAARAPLSQRHLQHLHRLDDLHYVEQHGDTREAHCEERRQTAKADPDHWSLHHEGVKGYVDCICAQRQPSLVCQALHAEGVAQAKKVVESKVAEHAEAVAALGEDPMPAPHIPEELQGAFSGRSPDGVPLSELELSERQSRASVLGYSNQSLQRAIPIGPCDAPVSCTVCSNNACISAPFSIGLDGTSPAEIGDTAKNVLNVIKTGYKAATASCFSVSCSACMGLKPGDFLRVFIHAGASASCGNWQVFFSSFKLDLTLEMCLSGGPLQKILDIFKKSDFCWGLPTIEYYPFVGKMGLNYVFNPWWLAKSVEFSTGATWPVHGLAPAVINHCKASVPARGTLDTWIKQYMFDLNSRCWGKRRACKFAAYPAPHCTWPGERHYTWKCEYAYLMNRKLIWVRIKTLGWKMSLRTRLYKEWR